MFVDNTKNSDSTFLPLSPGSRPAICTPGIIQSSGTGAAGVLVSTLLLLLLLLQISVNTCSAESISRAFPGSAANYSSSNSTRTHPLHVTTTLNGQVDMCLSCHNEKPDRAHGREVMGCHVCHRGNPLAGTMERAHTDLLKNPGELRYAENTCGITGCHPDEVARTRKSLMATNRGIISTLRYYWGESDSPNENITIADITAGKSASPAIDYFKKLCGTCHTGMEKGRLQGFLAEKGGGCTACHSVKPGGVDAVKGTAHIQMVKAVPSENCIRCHNRSGRIGLTYQGRYESEGYATPYEEGELSSKQLDDGRYYRDLPQDVHHGSGMVCADCHTQKEVMGDGHEHAHMQEQLEIECETCHTEPDKLLQIVETAAIPYSTWKHEMDKLQAPRLNIIKKDNSFFIKGLADTRMHPLHAPSRGDCMQPVHRRLSCQACHSTWVPQCYGCHVQYDRGKTQLDKIKGRETPGRWKEFKSLVRFNTPPLGILVTDSKTGLKDTASAHQSHEKIVILVPG